MQVLKINENIREDLAKLDIVVCSYQVADGSIADCIDLIYQDQFPNLEKIEVIISTPLSQ